MATPTLSTRVSRRTMIAGSAAALPAVTALPALGFPVENVPPAVSAVNADVRLFRRIALAERLRNQHARACRLLDRLRESLWDHPDYRELPGICVDSLRWDAAWRTGRRGLMLRRSDLFRRYAAAVRGAVATPAHTLPGLHAKLALAVIASRRGDARIYLYEDREWLEYALTDMARLAELWPASPGTIESRHYNAAATDAAVMC